MNAKSKKILQSAIKLYISNGIKKTTMDEIAQTANVSKVTIYKYYGDKDAFYHEVGKSLLNEYIQKISYHMTESIDLKHKIKSVMDTLTDFITSHKLTLCQELILFNNKLQTDYDNYAGKYREIIISLISDGKQNMQIRNDIDNEYLFRYIDMGISYFQNNIEYRNKMLSDDHFKDDFLAFLLSNIFIK